jgi:uridine kinase
MIKCNILGASGCGVTSLGGGLSLALKVPVFDADDFYWKKGDPPYAEKNPIGKRHELLAESVLPHPNWIISGSMTSWSQTIEPELNVAIYLHAPAEIRVARLRERETRKFGARIAPGGDMHQQHEEFILWAAQYEEGILPGRNKARHMEWLQSLGCPTFALDSSGDLRSLLLASLQELKKLGINRGNA